MTKVFLRLRVAIVVTLSATACSNLAVLNPARDFWRPDPRHVETVFTFPGLGASLIPDDDVIWVLYGTRDQRTSISRIDRTRNTFEDNVASVVFPGWVERRAGADIARAGVIWSSNYFQGKVPRRALLAAIRCQEWD